MINFNVNNYTIKLAENQEEIEAGLHLRYKVYCQEIGAVILDKYLEKEIEFDDLDQYCDHLILIDNSVEGQLKDKVVGYYRLIQKEAADKVGGFYSTHEFDISDFLNNYKGKVLELGRTCVLPKYRNSATMNLLWKGVAKYIEENNIDAMFGCVSAPGLDCSAYKEGFSFLYHNYSLDYSITAKDGVSMNMMKNEDIDPKQAIKNLPPLIKGYLKVNAKFGQEAFVDYDYNLTDIFVMADIKNADEKYKKHYLSVEK